jgi:hypothetical protein
VGPDGAAVAPLASHMTALLQDRARPVPCDVRCGRAVNMSNSYKRAVSIGDTQFALSCGAASHLQGGLCKRGLIIYTRRLRFQQTNTSASATRIPRRDQAGHERASAASVKANDVKPRRARINFSRLGLLAVTRAAV